MLLAGDVGGTKTLLGLFARAEPRPKLIAHHAYPTNDFRSFTAILDAFATDVAQPFTVAAAAVGVAGPVVGDRAALTNIAWDISVAEIAARFDVGRVALINDLAAMAASVAVLEGDEILVLQAGEARADGNAAVIAAGTGLGAAYLHRVNGRLQPVPTESGHADFAARTDREMALVRMLREEFGRAEVEHVLCGPGLRNLHRFTHGGESCSTVAGVYVGGGIAPKILPALTDGRFLEAFRAKGMMSGLVARMPVRVILNADAGLVGAAVTAQEL